MPRPKRLLATLLASAPLLAGSAAVYRSRATDPDHDHRSGDALATRASPRTDTLANPLLPDLSAGAKGVVRGVTFSRAAIDSIFARFDAPGSPGCVVAVTRRGRVVYGRGYGLADRATGEPLSIRTMLAAGSMHKQFTAFAILLLERDGKLSLDDPARKYIPELPDYGTPITIRELLHHTSGLRDLSEVRWLAGDNGAPELAYLSRQRGLSFAPGTEYLYSNTDYSVLQRVVERVSGEPEPRFLTERIFRPLGMLHTGIDGPSSVPKAPAYEGGPGAYADASGSGGGGFRSTPEDLARWEANFYEPRVGGRDILAKMLEEGHLHDGERVPYALGLHTEPYRGIPRFWHGGLSNGYRSQFMHYPRQGVGVLVMCNLRSAEPVSLAERVSDVALAGLLPSDAPPPSRGVPSDAARARNAGVYVDPFSLGVASVQPRDGGRDRGMALLVWATWYPLHPLGRERYRVEGQPLALEFRDAPGGRELVEQWDGRQDGRRRAPVFRRDDRTIPRASLANFAGTYSSPDLGVTWRVSPDRGGLRISGGIAEISTLEPRGRDLFGDQDGLVLVAFRRDDARRVVGLTVSTARARGIGFKRR